MHAHQILWQDSDSDVRMSRWKVLPVDQRELIKAYIVNVIVRYSSDEQTLQRTKLHLGKLNLILVQVFAMSRPSHCVLSHVREYLDNSLLLLMFSPAIFVALFFVFLRDTQHMAFACPISRLTAMHVVVRRS